MPTASSCSVRAILEQARQYSKAEMVRRVDESDMKIKSLEKQLAALMELRDRELVVLDTLKYLLSPIYTLPAELLAEIFKRTIDEDTHITDVLRVSQVCSDWRQVAHTTPRLWTGRMFVRLDDEGDDWEQAHADGWKAWLSRSAALPIPITLSLCQSPYIHQGLLEEVLKTASRWRSLQLDSPNHQDGSFLIRLLAERRLDSLEELDLRHTLYVEHLGGVPSFTTAPCLRKLGMSISPSVPILVPCTLTELTLRHCPSPDSALDVIARCAGLVKLTVRTVGWSVLPRARQHNLALNCLRTLSFHLYQDAEHFTPFFNNLSAPALQRISLHFGDMERTEHWTEAHFTAFQLQAPNITQLELRYADLGTDEFIAAILHAPFLTHLKLYRCDCFDDTAITALRYEDGRTPLVPRLHSLAVEGTRRVTDDILASMIATRWWTDTALALRSDPPAVARWTHVELGYDLSGHSLLQDMPSCILIPLTGRTLGRDSPSLWG
ncbi:hypothetical protein C8R45DRAFT_486696 [Mycena sanguinolenta]|nr:hypothetical protein C8R45DRAFT_486696 [Mycena sanguinolenta]